MKGKRIKGMDREGRWDEENGNKKINMDRFKQDGGTKREQTTDKEKMIQETIER